MEDLFARPLLVVTGKGGVGKSTVAAALGLAASRRGLRTVIVEVAARADVPHALGLVAAAGPHGERELSDRLHHISIDPHQTMEEYLRRQLPLGALAGLVSRSRVFTALTAATPGMAELLTMGKVWELARRDRHSHGSGSESCDLVVLDAPATGHALAMLEAPRTFASVARVGPVAKQSGAIASFLRDSRQTAVLAVASAEEMPVSETLELRARLRADLGFDLALVIANAVVPQRFSDRDEHMLRSAPPSPARHAALFAAAWADQQSAQLVRLRAGIGDVSLVTLPLVFARALDRAALEALSRELDA
jgi:anion-transporting  ArsA/GET3 family ATPase